MSVPSKKALVTGGAAGLGAALVAELVQQGFTVFSLDISEPEPRQNVIDIVADLSTAMRAKAIGNW